MVNLNGSEISLLINALILTDEAGVDGKQVTRTFSKNKRPHAKSLHAKLIASVNEDKTMFVDGEFDISDLEKNIGKESIESREWSIGDGEIADAVVEKLK